MADGKKSPEYTRLAVSFLAGVAITVLIMSLTAGQLLQGYLSFGTLGGKQVTMVQTAKDSVAKKVTNVKDLSGMRDVMGKRFAKVKGIQDANYRMRDGREVSARDVISYTFRDGETVATLEIGAISISGADNMLDVVSFTLADGGYKDMEDVVTLALYDGTTVGAAEFQYVEIQESSTSDFVYTLEFNE